MYANDPAADDVRPTKDVDISLSVASASELEEIRLKLIERGFTQTPEDNVICQFRYQGVKVDVMNTKEISWAPANPWFKAGDSGEVDHSIPLQADQGFRCKLTRYFRAKLTTPKK